MKKAIAPPENWQDFESLCKKLFGEVWGCPNTIKKNGRSGQTQAGVDVYAVPEGRTEYWGIQCKGKDNYKKSKLSKREIDEEIEKAHTFQPKLEVFAFATSALKDVEIEAYIRIKNLESVKAQSFQILLYCWEDLVDLIEENRDTYNWYVNSIQFKNQFDVDVRFTNNLISLELEPKFLKTITDYQFKEEVLKPENFYLDSDTIKSLLKPYTSPPNRMPYPFGPMHRVNYTWCNFTVLVENIGSSVLENWKLLLHFPDNIKKFDDDYFHDSFNEQRNIESQKKRTTFVNSQDRLVVYKPLNNAPLIQRDSHKFKC